MEPISFGFIVSVFFAGILMFLAPCTLPLVPAYLAFISGIKEKELLENNTPALRQRLVKNALAFVLGFSIVFISLGALAGLLGGSLLAWRGPLIQFGGVFMIIFGLMMLNVIKITPLLRERRLQLPAWVTPGEPSSASVLGAIFALGWTPCVGPVLATVLFIAITEAQLVSGLLLLSVFSLGLSLPFILTAFMYSRASSFIHKHAGFSSVVSTIGGLVLILVGMLFLFNNFVLLVSAGTKLFDWLGLSAFFELL